MTTLSVMMARDVSHRGACPRASDKLDQGRRERGRLSLKMEVRPPQFEGSEPPDLVSSVVTVSDGHSELEESEAAGRGPQGRVGAQLLDRPSRTVGIDVLPS